METILAHQKIENIKKIMKKDLEESLRHMQKNPTTGLPHNQQVVSAQVETIFIIDSLIEEIKQLNQNILDSNKQNEKLERANYKLQVAMFVLSFVATFVVVYPIFTQLVSFIFFKYIIPILKSVNNLKGYPTGLIILILSYTTTLIASIFALKILKKYVTKNVGVKDEIKITDKVHIKVVDNDGIVKEEKDA